MLPSDNHVNQRQLTDSPAQNRTVGNVQQSSHFNLAHARSAYGGASRLSYWLHLGAKLPFRRMFKGQCAWNGPISEARTKVSECLPSACLDNAMTQIIAKFIV